LNSRSKLKKELRRSAGAEEGEAEAEEGREGNRISYMRRIIERSPSNCL